MKFLCSFSFSKLARSYKLCENIIEIPWGKKVIPVYLKTVCDQWCTGLVNLDLSVIYRLIVPDEFKAVTITGNRQI
jgi:hypothetical protein